MNRSKRLVSVAILIAMSLMTAQPASAGDERRLELAFSISFDPVTPSGSGLQVTGVGRFSVSGAVAGSGDTTVALTVTPNGPGATGQAREEGVQTFVTSTGSFKADFRGRVHDADTLHPRGKGLADFTGLSGEFSSLTGTGKWEVDVDFTAPPYGRATGTYLGRIDLRQL